MLPLTGLKYIELRGGRGQRAIQVATLNKPEILGKLTSALGAMKISVSALRTRNHRRSERGQLDDQAGSVATRYIASSCLAGLATRYDGTAAPCGRVEAAVERGAAIPFCPEQGGGLTTPRAPAEIVGGDGRDVLKGNARVVTKNGEDVTEEFIRGARQMLSLAQLTGASAAILKSNSPSCGAGTIYDGTFSGNMVEGDGVAAALLREAGLKIFTEKEFADD